ncbi:MAG: SMP-30/gluconolactonase/LRE family protein, partial [Planctomycetota bacterium]
EDAAPRRATFLIEGEDWELVSDGHGFNEGVTPGALGEVYFTDLQDSKIFRIDAEGETKLIASDTGQANGLMMSPDGRLIACANGKKQIVAYSDAASSSSLSAPQVLASNVTSNDVCVRHDGLIFWTSPKTKQVMRLFPGQSTPTAVATVPGCNGIVFSPDQTQLYVTDFRGRMAYVMQVTDDGQVQHVQPYLYVHLPNRIAIASNDGMTVDTEGYVYVATRLGVQICDQPGRVHLIIPPPTGARYPANLCFGGPDFNYLYAACGDKVFRRRLSRTGAVSWREPVTPPKPRL